MRANSSIIGPKQPVGDEIASGLFSLNGVGREIPTTTGWPPLKVGFALGNSTYMNKFLNINDYETGPQGIDFSPDGTHLLVTGVQTDGWDQWLCSIPFDISSATYVTTTSSAETSPMSCRWGDNGFKAYLCGNGADKVAYVPLTTAYDISTAGTEVQSDRLNNLNPNGASDTNPSGLFFKPDGTKVFTCNPNYDNVNEYSLTGNAWDISSGNMSFENTFSLSSQVSEPHEIFFKPDGTKFYILGRYQAKIFQYSCPTAWSLTNASYDSVSASFPSSDVGTTLGGMTFSVTGKKLYIVGSGNDKIYQYSVEADK